MRKRLLYAQSNLFLYKNKRFLKIFLKTIGKYGLINCGGGISLSSHSNFKE